MSAANKRIVSRKKVHWSHYGLSVETVEWGGGGGNLFCQFMLFSKFRGGNRKFFLPIIVYFEILRWE